MSKRYGSALYGNYPFLPSFNVSYWQFSIPFLQRVFLPPMEFIPWLIRWHAFGVAWWRNRVPIFCWYVTSVGEFGALFFNGGIFYGFCLVRFPLLFKHGPIVHLLARCLKVGWWYVVLLFGHLLACNEVFFSNKSWEPSEVLVLIKMRSLLWIWASKGENSIDVIGWWMEPCSLKYMIVVFFYLVLVSHGGPFCQGNLNSTMMGSLKAS